MEGIGRYFDDVNVGDELPLLEKEINLARMMAYGAATWDFIRFHYDADYVREQGFKAPFVDGQMLGGFLAQLMQDWAGPQGFLRKLGFRNRVMVYPGDVITCGGLVTSAYIQHAGGRHGEGQDSGGQHEEGQDSGGQHEEGQDSDGLVECDLWIENQDGDKVVQPASAVVRLPRRGA